MKTTKIGKSHLSNSLLTSTDFHRIPRTLAFNKVKHEAAAVRSVDSRSPAAGGADSATVALEIPFGDRASAWSSSDSSALGVFSRRSGKPYEIHKIGSVDARTQLGNAGLCDFGELAPVHQLCCEIHKEFWIQDMQIIAEAAPFQELAGRPTNLNHGLSNHDSMQTAESVAWCMPGLETRCNLVLSKRRQPRRSGNFKSKHGGLIFPWPNSVARKHKSHPP